MSPRPPSPTRLLKLADAAAVLGVSLKWLRTHGTRGELSFYRIVSPRIHRCDERAMLAWMERQRPNGF